jgi:transcriptional regulator with XRE-family HTH domain
VSLRLPPIIVGPRLVELREERGLTQTQLADVLRVSRRSVQAWEAGHVPQPRHRWALHRFFKVEEAAA